VCATLDEAGPAEIVVHEVTTPFHVVTVADIGARRYLRFEHNRQSSMYLDDTFSTDFEYPSYFHLALAIAPEASRTLAIGLGGGTVVKRMWRDYPGMRIDAIEIDPEVVSIARRYFALPDDDRIRIVVDDGRRFLETSGDAYDIIIVDAFDDGFVPLPLTTEEFHRVVRDHLSEGGVLVYNVIGSLAGTHSRPFRSLFKTLRNTWRSVRVFRVDEGVDAEGGNLIVLASDARLTDEDLLARIADRVGGRVTVPAFHLFGEDLVRGGIRTGDVPILTDPPAHARH